MADHAVVDLYESLARFQWRRARRGVAADALDGLELRKRLAPSSGGRGPTDGGAALDTWLRPLVGGVEGARVLDLGCGFGVSLMRAVDAGACSCVGLTPSPFQVARARGVATARGVADRCRFEVAALDEALPRADIVFAVEALGHTSRLDDALAAVVEALSGAARPRFVWVEDLLIEGGGPDEDVEELANSWSSPPLRSLEEADEALAAAGLHVTQAVDLTEQVPSRAVAVIDRARSRLGWARRLLPFPPVRRVLDAFAGGLHLERLYARGKACYRVVMAETREVPPT